MRYAFHVDMDAFFAAIEQRANPHWRGKPVIVGGAPGTRSAVASASYEARAFGVRAGMPTHDAQRLCPQGIFVPGNPAHYLHTSVRLYRLLERFSPRVEPASVDEAYLEIESEGDVRVVGQRIMDCIEAELGLTASLGISDSKYLAKVCSSFQKPRGLTVLRRADVPALLWPRPLEVLFGVGEKTAARLHALGCTTVGEVAQLPVRIIELEFGVVGVALHDLAAGRDRWQIVRPSEAPDARTIGHEHTLDRDVYDQEAVEALLSALCERVARRARRAQLAGMRVVLKLRDPRFFTRTHGRVLPQPVDTAEDLFASARLLLAETRFWIRGVRLVGVSLQRLVPTAAARQLCFDFAAGGQKKSPVVDRIRAKYGEHAIGLARSLPTSARGRRREVVSFRPPQVG